MTLSATNKILDILSLFNKDRLEITIDEISSETEIPQSSAYRYVRLLCDRGFLEKSSAGLYQLGYRFQMLSHVAMKSNRDLRLVALPSMQRIAEQIVESVSLMRIADQYAICIESIEGQQAIRAVVEQGRLQPLYVGASSKVLLAALDESEWDQYLPESWKPFTGTTITDPQIYRQQLRRVREQGYAVSDGEIDEGGRAVAVPIRNLRGKVVAALSIEGPYFRMGDEVIKAYIELLRTESDLIQSKLS